MSDESFTESGAEKEAPKPAWGRAGEAKGNGADPVAEFFSAPIDAAQSSGARARSP